MNVKQIGMIVIFIAIGYVIGIKFPTLGSSIGL